MKDVKTILGTAGRLGITSGIIASIGWVILTVHPEAITPQHLEVKEAKADIYDLSLVDRTHTQKFAGSLENLGHEPPRVYDLNGNTVFFSTAVHRGKLPEEILREYQEQFVRDGVNTKVYMQSPDVLSRLGTPAALKELNTIEKHVLRGEVVPQRVSRNHVMMNGAILDLDEGKSAEELEEGFEDDVVRLETSVERFTHAYSVCGGDEKTLKAMSATKAPDSPITLLAKKIDKAAEKTTNCSTNGGICSEVKNRYEIASNEMDALKRAVDQQPSLRQCDYMKRMGREGVRDSKDNFTKRVRAFRSIEADYHPKSNKTHVTASWSDEDFDAKKMRPKRFHQIDQSEVTGGLPLCEGCLRTLDFGGNGNEAGYSTQQITSPGTTRAASDFYLKQLTKDGWEVSESSMATNEIFKQLGQKVYGSRWIRVTRGNEHMSVHIRADPRTGKTLITSTQSR